MNNLPNSLLPNPLGYNGVNIAIRNSMKRSERTVCEMASRILPPNLAHCFPIQFCLRAILSTSMILRASMGPQSLLRGCISHIFGMSSKEKMFWVYALSIIARVAYFFSFWNWANRNNPRSSIRAHRSCFSEFESRIAICALSFPRPAFIGIPNSHLIPKSNACWQISPSRQCSSFSPVRKLPTCWFHWPCNTEIIQGGQA